VLGGNAQGGKVEYKMNTTKMAIKEYAEVMIAPVEEYMGLYFPDEVIQYNTQDESDSWRPDWAKGQTWADHPNENWDDYEGYDDYGNWLS
jgi:hypothetical protein